VRHVVRWLGWWLALFWLWMLVAGDWNRIEFLAAICAAAVGASLAESARAALGIGYSLPLNQIRRSLTVPPIILVDFGIVIWVLLRSIARLRVDRGVFLARPFDAGGDDVAGAAHRAYTVAVAGFSPNAYVIDIDRERNEVFLHDLVPFKKSEEPAGD